MTRTNQNQQPARMWAPAMFIGILFCCMATGATKDPNDLLVLGWKDLTVKVEFEDPFEDLTEEQLAKLGLYVRVQTLKKRKPESVSEAMDQEATEAASWLRKEKVDIKGLLAKRQEIMQLRAKRASATNPILNGKRIRMPGYALPLEYDGKKVTEFLLVPWVGACIHTPPPPPNQIVYVKMKEATKMHSRFQPVWVSGPVAMGATKKNLYLVDGSSDINIGYSISNATVEPYKKAEAGNTTKQNSRAQKKASKNSPVMAKLELEEKEQ